eukprot:SAG11_NODE_19303_length_469_cov_3.640541_1_plen_100_part_00
MKGTFLCVDRDGGSWWVITSIVPGDGARLGAYWIFCMPANFGASAGCRGSRIHSRGWVIHASQIECQTTQTGSARTTKASDVMIVIKLECEYSYSEIVD